MLRALFFAGLLGLVTCSAASGNVSSRTLAARVPALWGYGVTVDEIAPLPERPGNKIGYKYWTLKILFLNTWTMDGQFVAYQEDNNTIQYQDLGKTPEEAAQKSGVAADTFKKPWKYTFPPGLLVLGGIVVLGILKKILFRD